MGTRFLNIIFWVGIILCISGLPLGVRAYQQPYISWHDINFSTGNKYLGETDYIFAGPTGDFSFTRHYNSQGTDDSGMGTGWTCSWGENLTLYPELGLIVFSRPDGKMFHFRDTGSNTWTNDVWKRAEIEQDEETLDYILTRPDTSVSRFDSQGRLIRKQDANGNAVTLAYTGDRLTGITDGFGHTLSLAYDTDGRLIAADTPVGIFGYAYDGNGNLTSVTRPDAKVRTYLYEDSNDIHNLTRVTDPGGVIVQAIGYDSQDRATSSSLMNGTRAVTIAYKTNFTRVVTDSLGVSTTYTLSAIHGVAQVTSVDGPGCAACGSDSDTRYAYNDRQQVTAITDGRGRVTLFTYDDNGNKLTETRAAGTDEQILISYIYDSVFNKITTLTRPSVAGADHFTLSMVYDGAGNLLNRTENGETGSGTLSRSVIYTYDSLGRVTSMDGPRTDVDDRLIYAYYPNAEDQGENRGLLQSITNSLGQTLTFSNYSGWGKPGQIINANKIPTLLTYNARGLVAQSVTGSRTTTYEYDSLGRLIGLTLPQGRTLTYSYALCGHLSRITDSLGNTISYTYDSEGRKTGQQIFDSDGNLTAYTAYAFDENGRLSSILNPDDSSRIFGYDSADNLISQINELGNETVFAYDGLNRLIQITEPPSHVTEIAYDSHGNQISVIDAEGRITAYAYDDFGNRITRVSPDSGTTTYAYDPAGNLIQKTDANHITVQYAYDALNRLVSAAYPDSALDTIYTWDQGTNGVGHLTASADGTGRTEYSYDVYGNLIQEIRYADSLRFTTTYTWNLNGETTAITYPGGRRIDFQRDAAGRVTGVTSTFQGQTLALARDLDYLPFGPATAMTLGNGLVLDRIYDHQYRLTAGSAGDLFHRTYTYSANGQVSAIADILDNTRSQSFTYDSLDRLTTAEGTFGQLAYTYDRTGNRTARSLDSARIQYAYQNGSSRLIQISGTGDPMDYTYDAAGNPLTRGDTAFTWNQAGRLAQVALNADTLGKYGYDAFGRRTVKSTDQGAVIYLYDRSGNLIAESDSTGSMLREYAFIDGRRLTLFEYSLAPEITVKVTSSDAEALKGVPVYAFDAESNAYTGISATTDDHGQAVFTRNSLGDRPCLFRADYLGGRFWSETVTLQNTNTLSLVIEVDTAQVTVFLNGEPRAGANVFVFSENKSYMGIYGVTDSQGVVSFSLPKGETYTFRADLLGSRYWSAGLTIGLSSSMAIETGGGDLTLTLSQGQDQPMTGIQTYLFSESGTYLGQSSATDGQGQAVYTVPEGTYKIRADYLGYRFMTDPVSVEEDTATDLTIAHESVQVRVMGKDSDDAFPLEGLSCYVFTSSGAYQGLTGQTDPDGTIAFDLPEKAYKIRADYMSKTYWSSDLTWQEGEIFVNHGTAAVTLAWTNTPLSWIPVYVFSPSGTYLGRSAETDASGRAVFSLPAAEYKFRADYMGSRYWSEDLTLTAFAENPVEISTGGGIFELTLTQGDDLPMEGVPAYLFADSGTYLGESAVTSSSGNVSFDLADGSFKIRMDYLGYPYWTRTFTIPDELDMEYAIPHRTVTLFARTGFQGETAPVQNARAYVFTPQGKYMNLSSVTDDIGQAGFELPEQEYRIRLDHLGGTYFTDPFTSDTATLTVPEGRARIRLTGAGGVLPDVPVYLFSSSDTYLGLFETTDGFGRVLFQVPEGSYKFRANYQASRFWASGEVLADTTSDIDLDTGGGALAVTVRSSPATVLEGVTAYLFSETGTYLAQSAVTDDRGIALFDAANGRYQVRADYLGYQYWSDVVEVPDSLSADILIDHSGIAVSVIGDPGESPFSLPGINCHVFTGSGAYTGLSTVTDENGQAHFTLPDQPCRVRADYLRVQYWSDPLNGEDTAITIPHGTLSLNVTDSSQPAQGLTAYLFNTAGTYLGLSSVTGENGTLSFTVPEGSYQIRVDSGGEKYWTEELNILPHQDNEFALELTDDSLSLYDPRPLRRDGPPPEYRPLLALEGDLLPGLLTASRVKVSDRARTFWYITDHLDTPRMLVDDTGAVAWQADFAPFGSVCLAEDRVDSHFRFPGQYFDGETGLHYNWHRYYDPMTGRYLTPDPIGLAGGINPFVYANANPINFIDPLGLDTRGEGLSVGFSVFGLTGNYTFQLVEDDNGDFGIALSTAGGGTAEVAGFSAMKIKSSTNANSINQLHGKSVLLGGGVTPLYGGYIVEREFASEYQGTNKLYGLNAGVVRSYVDIHGVLSDTAVYNFSEILENFFEFIFKRNNVDDDECKNLK